MKKTAPLRTPSSASFKWTVVGLGIGAFLTITDYHIMQKLALPIMGITVLVLITLIILGAANADGPIRAFKAGSGQPSEMAKLVIIIYLVSVVVFQTGSAQPTHPGCLAADGNCRPDSRIDYGPARFFCSNHGCISLAPCCSTWQAVILNKSFY